MYTIVVGITSKQVRQTQFSPTAPHCWHGAWEHRPDMGSGWTSVRWGQNGRGSTANNSSESYNIMSNCKWMTSLMVLLFGHKHHLSWTGSTCYQCWAEFSSSCIWQCLTLIMVMTHNPQPFYGPFSGTIRVRRYQKKASSGRYGARQDNKRQTHWKSGWAPLHLD